MEEYKKYVVDGRGKIPEVMIKSDTGICLMCFSKWTEEDGCLNKKCPLIQYRKNGDEQSSSQ